MWTCQVYEHMYRQNHTTEHTILINLLESGNNFYHIHYTTLLAQSCAIVVFMWKPLFAEFKVIYLNLYMKLENLLATYNVRGCMYLQFMFKMHTRKCVANLKMGLYRFSNRFTVSLYSIKKTFGSLVCWFQTDLAAALLTNTSFAHGWFK